MDPFLLSPIGYIVPLMLFYKDVFLALNNSQGVDMIKQRDQTESNQTKSNQILLLHIYHIN